jgi:hypothetical protein
VGVEVNDGDVAIDTLRHATPSSRKWQATMQLKDGTPAGAPRNTSKEVHGDAPP